METCTSIIATAPFLLFEPNNTPMFTSMKSKGRPAIIDISFYSPKRLFKRMMTIGGENYTFVVDFKIAFTGNLIVH